MKKRAKIRAPAGFWCWIQSIPLEQVQNLITKSKILKNGRKINSLKFFKSSQKDTNLDKNHQKAIKMSQKWIKVDQNRRQNLMQYQLLRSKMDTNCQLFQSKQKDLDKNASNCTKTSPKCSSKPMYTSAFQVQIKRCQNPTYR